MNYSRNNGSTNKTFRFVCNHLGLMCAVAITMAYPCFGFMLLTSSAQGSPGGIFLIFGPADYTRSAGKPVSVSSNFSARNTNASYTLRIFNGGKNNQFARSSSAVVALNGFEVAGTRDFDQQVAFIEKRVTLAFQNTLVVEVRSAPGSGITIEIVGIDLDPPTIGATAAPPPNAAAWNNTDVTVSFACTDELSGIASCPPPLTISTEGANQPVSGTTTDAAGNTATASLTLNIDKTPPNLALTSPADQTVVGASAITLAGTVNDSLSGIERVTCNGVPATLSGTGFSCTVGLVEGFNSINVQASDRAGNVSSRSLTATSVMPQSVGPDGGTIVAMGGRVRLVIPPGALEQVVPIIIRPLPAMPGDPLSDTAFEFGPDGTRFLQPVALTLSYNPAVVSQDRAASLRIVKLFADGTQRLMTPGSVDAANHTVTAEIHGFSSYRVTIQCSDPAAVCLFPPTLTAEYVSNRTINLSWTYPPLQKRAMFVEIERAVVRGGAPCTEGTPYCVCDSAGCRLSGLQPPHDADYSRLAILGSSTTSYIDFSIESNSAFYWYRIRWSSPPLVSYPSDPVKVFVFGLFDTPPDPISLTATALTCGGVELAWPSVSEAEGYRIERAAPGGRFQTVDLLPSQSTVSHTDTTPMIEGVTYTYRVISVAGPFWSAGKTATVLTPPTCLGSTSIEVTTYFDHEQRNVEWVGVREGSGAWRKIDGTGGRYDFDVMAAAAGSYSVAVVCKGGLQVEGRLLEMTTADPHTLSVTCGRQNESGRHLVTVGALNVPASNCVKGGLGAYWDGSCHPSDWEASAFTGIYDVVTLALSNNSLAASRIDLARDVPVSGSLGLVSSLGAAVAAEPHTVSSIGASEPVLLSVDLLTRGGTSAQLGFGLGSMGRGVMHYGGLPKATQLSGDIHRSSVILPLSGRSIYTYIKTPEDLSVDFSSLPAMLANPSVEIAGRVPYLRVLTDFHASAAALPDAAGYEIQYQHYNVFLDSRRTWRVFISQHSLVGMPLLHELPDLTSALGWQSDWELPVNATSINWAFTAYTTKGTISTFVQSLFSPLNKEGHVVPHGFVRREFSVSGTVQ